MGSSPYEIFEARPCPSVFPDLLKAFSNGPQGLLSSERPSTLRHRLNRRQRTQDRLREGCAAVARQVLVARAMFASQIVTHNDILQCDAVAWVPLSMEHVCCPSPSRKDGYDASPTRACVLASPGPPACQPKPAGRGAWMPVSVPVQMLA
jgi:hypothetical protein